MESYLGKGRKPPENDAKPHHRRENNDGFAALPLGFLDELAQSSSLEDVLLCTSYWVREIFQADRASITLDENEREMRLYAFDGNDVQPQECSTTRMFDSNRRHLGWRSFYTTKSGYVEP